jgi:acyl transferase domain-containing protein
VAVIFTQLGALSGRGRVRPFEAGSDGTLLGEGLGIVALKRLSDALEDGDRVYAVIRAVGQASDGRGHGLLAPSEEGETLAIERAYRASGIDPASVGLIEAHGTGIPLGDRTEVAALRNVFGGRTTPAPSIALGSVKSMISHCIPAAGIAGLIKTALALHHKVLPPTLCEKVSPDLGIEDTPFFVNTKLAPWIWHRGMPRRAGINSFGFGGINAHAIVEEAPPDTPRPSQLSPWSAELCVVSAQDEAALSEELLRLAAAVGASPQWPLASIAAALAERDTRGRCRLAIVARSRDELLAQLGQAAQRIGQGKRSWATRGGAVYGEDRIGGSLAFLFPGEGSQYLGMLADVAVCFEEVRVWFDFWRDLYDEPSGAARTDLVFPPTGDASETRQAELEQRLNQMDVGSEAVFIGGQAMCALLRRLGVVPDVMMGHSSGESSALAASGALAAEDPLQLAAFVRRLNAVYREVLAEGKIPTGALLAVGALPAQVVAGHVAAFGGEVVVAMDNCPNQTVLYGSVTAIGAIQKSLSAAGGILMPLPFDRGYHTPAFAAMSAAFRAFYAEVGLRCTPAQLPGCFHRSQRR